jgi:hypothetical protein
MAVVYVVVGAFGFALVFPVLGASRLAVRVAWTLLALVVVLLYSRWFVIVAATVAERAGLQRVFARSSDLTAGHRPQLAALVAVYGAALVGSLLVIDVFVPDAAADREVAITALLAVGAVLRTAIGAAAFHYLKQQKEAASPEQLREVFD